MKYFIIVLIFFVGFIQLNYAAQTYDKLIVSDYGPYSLVPPNTTFAVDLAKIYDSEYLSINVHISKDGEIVLYDKYFIKDNTNVDELTEVKNKNSSINDLNLSNIKKLKFKYGVKDSQNKILFENLFNIISLDDYVAFINNLYKDRNKILKFYVKFSDIDIYKKKNIDISKQVIEKLKTFGYLENQIILEYQDIDEIKRVRTEIDFKGIIVYKVVNDNLMFLPENNKENLKNKIVKISEFIDDLSIFVDYVCVPLSKVILNKSFDHFFVSSLVEDIKTTKVKILVYNDIANKKFPDNFKNYREIALILLNDLNVDGILTDEYYMVKNILYYLKN